MEPTVQRWFMNGGYGHGDLWDISFHLLFSSTSQKRLFEERWGWCIVRMKTDTQHTDQEEFISGHSCTSEKDSAYQQLLISGKEGSYNRVTENVC